MFFYIFKFIFIFFNFKINFENLKNFFSNLKLHSQQLLTKTMPNQIRSGVRDLFQHYFFVGMFFNYFFAGMKTKSDPNYKDKNHI